MMQVALEVYELRCAWNNTPPKKTILDFKIPFNFKTEEETKKQSQMTPQQIREKKKEASRISRSVWGLRLGVGKGGKKKIPNKVKNIKRK